jgi:hypothetical protein
VVALSTGAAAPIKKNARLYHQRQRVSQQVHSQPSAEATVEGFLHWTPRAWFNFAGYHENAKAYRNTHGKALFIMRRFDPYQRFYFPGEKSLFL